MWNEWNVALKCERLWLIWMNYESIPITRYTVHTRRRECAPPQKSSIESRIIWQRACAIEHSELKDTYKCTYLTKWKLWGFFAFKNSISIYKTERSSPDPSCSLRPVLCTQALTNRLGHSATQPVHSVIYLFIRFTWMAGTWLKERGVLNSRARNMAIALLCASFFPSTSSTGIWPNGIAARSNTNSRSSQVAPLFYCRKKNVVQRNTYRPSAGSNSPCQSGRLQIWRRWRRRGDARARRGPSGWSTSACSSASHEGFWLENGVLNWWFCISKYSSVLAPTRLIIPSFK